MHLTTRNVNTAFKTLIEGIEDQSIPTIKTPSRNGPVIQIEGPIILTYEMPRERVLFNKVRDANPFFHLYEALWMLAGRNDVASLKYYASKISDFSDDGTAFNGAYGYRWRYAKVADVYNTDHEPLQDQLILIINHLKNDPNSRRAVLQMWNVEDDLLKIDAPNKSKDVCCNISVMFSIAERDSEKRSLATSQPYPQKYLDITVTNRSNDIIWGMLGANYAHFSFLQEYIACALGVQVGKYHHMSNNAHVYTETNSGWHPEEWLREYRLKTMHDKPALSYGKGPNDAAGNVGTATLLFDAEGFQTFEKEIQTFVTLNGGPNDEYQQYRNSFIERVALPMIKAWRQYKLKNFEESLAWCDLIAAGDWRVVCENWIQKRKENFETRSGGSGE